MAPSALQATFPGLLEVLAGQRSVTGLILEPRAFEDQLEFHVFEDVVRGVVLLRVEVVHYWRE